MADLDFIIACQLAAEDVGQLQRYNNTNSQQFDQELAWALQLQNSPTALRSDYSPEPESSSSSSSSTMSSNYCPPARLDYTVLTDDRNNVSSIPVRNRPHFRVSHVLDDTFDFGFDRHQTYADNIRSNDDIGNDSYESLLVLNSGNTQKPASEQTLQQLESYTVPVSINSSCSTMPSKPLSTSSVPLPPSTSSPKFPLVATHVNLHQQNRHAGAGFSILLDVTQPQSYTVYVEKDDSKVSSKFLENSKSLQQPPKLTKSTPKKPLIDLAGARKSYRSPKQLHRSRRSAQPRLAKHKTSAKRSVSSKPSPKSRKLAQKKYKRSRSRIAETSSTEPPTKQAKVMTTACRICLDDVKPGDSMISLPCVHSFHSKCILSWLKISNTCPICRTVLPE